MNPPERGYTESGAADFVRVYKKTVAYAKLESMTPPYAIPVFNGRSVILEGRFPLSERDWEQFMTVFAAMKPALVERPDENEL